MKPINSPIIRKAKCFRACRECKICSTSWGVWKESYLYLPTRGNFIGISRKHHEILMLRKQMPLHYYCYYYYSFYCTCLVTELSCFHPFFLPVFPPSFSICPLSTEQKREVEVIYGYNPPCTAKKVNLNEVIYYLWQVFYTQNCLSKRVFIDFPYLPCQPLDCHCLSLVDEQFKMAEYSPSPGPLLQRLAFICVLVLRTLAFSCLKLCVWEEPIPLVVQITQIRSKIFYTPLLKILTSNRQ